MIQHPDHTGASLNPRAPWNQDAPPLECDHCGDTTEALEPGDECEDCMKGHYREVEST